MVLLGAGAGQLGINRPRQFSLTFVISTAARFLICTPGAVAVPPRAALVRIQWKSACKAFPAHYLAQGRSPINEAIVVLIIKIKCSPRA